MESIIRIQVEIAKENITVTCKGVSSRANITAVRAIKRRWLLVAWAHWKVGDYSTSVTATSASCVITSTVCHVSTNLSCVERVLPWRRPLAEMFFICGRCYRCSIWSKVYMMIRCRVTVTDTACQDFSRHISVNTFCQRCL